MRTESLLRLFKSPVGMLLIAADICQEAQEVLDEMAVIEDGLEDQLKAVDLGAGDRDDLEVKLFHLSENREALEDCLKSFHLDSMDILAEVIQLKGKTRVSDKKATIQTWDSDREDLRQTLDDIKRIWKIEVPS